ncbi:MAG: hypothetical protein LUC49_01215 [Prevotella sp.]|nr:hypothetical protein [Prevotella sp.]
MEFHRKASASKATLPLIIIVFVAAAVCAEALQVRLAVFAAGMLVTAYFVELTGVRYSLVKGFARLPSCCFLLLCMAEMPLATIDGALTVLLVTLALIVLFRAYREQAAPGTFFLAFLLIGIVSLRFVQILFFAPLWWLMAMTWLQAPSLRNTLATVFGLLLPYWILLAAAFYFGQTEQLWQHFAELGIFTPPCDGLFEYRLLIPTAVIAFFDIVAIAHFRFYNRGQSIQNTMFFNIIHATSLLALAFAIVQPAHAACALPIAVLCTSFSTAHFFAFARGKAATVLFILLIIAALAGIVLAIWKH